MRASVLEFRLGENVFCFDTCRVAYIFELEEYEPVVGLHESVVGITKYNDDVILLIDTDLLYRGDKTDKTEKRERKSVVVVFMDEDKNRYGLMVDEILEIEEIESVRPTLDLNSEDMVVNHYKDEKQESIVSEILPIPLFKKYRIPSITSKKSGTAKSADKVYGTKGESSYLIFGMSDKRFGIEAEKVLEVFALEKDFLEMDSDGTFYKGAVTVRDEVITLISRQPLSSCSEVILVEEGKRKFGIGVESVEDISFFSVEKIEFFNNRKNPVAGLYSLDEQVIAIVNIDFYASTLAISGKRAKGGAHSPMEHMKRKRDYLIFHIGSRRFAIDMRYVRQVVEVSSLTKTRAGSVASSEMVEFLATWSHEAVEVLRLDSLLGKIGSAEDSEAIFIEIEDSVTAFMVDDIDDIVYLDEDAVADASGEAGIIDGAIVYGEDVIARVNPFYIVKSG